MSQEEQLKRMRLEILNNCNDDSKDEVFEIMLNDAEIVALNTLYPYDKTKTELDKNDKRLMNWQIRCAIELYNKIGNVNIESYSENGVSVKYLTGLISKELMSELVPRVGVIK